MAQQGILPTVAVVVHALHREHGRAVAASYQHELAEQDCADNSFRRAASVVGLLISTEVGSGYASPDAAVMATCHAARILGDYSSHGGRYRIGWQPAGEAPGFGWTAIVEGDSGDYAVIDCRSERVVHA